MCDTVLVPNQLPVRVQCIIINYYFIIIIIIAISV